MTLLQIFEESFLLRPTKILNESSCMRKHCFGKGFSQLKLATKSSFLLANYETNIKSIFVSVNYSGIDRVSHRKKLSMNTECKFLLCVL